MADSPAEFQPLAATRNSPSKAILQVEVPTEPVAMAKVLPWAAKAPRWVAAVSTLG